MQPGQMAYDRGSTVFSPDGRLFQVEYAREAVKKGSTTIGIKYDGGVMLIVDRRVVSKLLEPKSTEKIHEIDDYIGCATSGLVADARVLVDEARKEAQVHRVNFGENIGVEMLVKKVCGSEGALGNGYNDINLHYGNWNVVVLPDWTTADDRMMVMSSEANKNLAGNMFFNRVPLTVSSWVDHHTGNYVWNGRCRFGIGFGSYKHILLAIDSETRADGTVLL